MTVSRWRQLVALVVVGTAVGLGSAEARAQGEVSGPVVALGYYEITPGDTVVVSVTGFETRNVTVATCGNNGRRGASDCNMRRSTGLTLFDGARTLGIVIPAPPVPCPCIVRVNDVTNQEVAVAPITLIGHPVAPVVGSPQAELLSVSVSASVAPDGLIDGLRTSLGGRTSYDLVVRVTNPSNERVENATASGTVVRGNGDVVTNVEIPDPGTLEPGQTFETTVVSELPRPVIAEFEWRVSASVAGQPTVVGTTTSTNVPWLLWLLAAFLVIDLIVLAVRFFLRSRRRRRMLREAELEGHVGPDPEAVEHERQRALV